MSERGRVLFLVESFPPPEWVKGGVQVSIRHLSEGLAVRQGVAVLAPAPWLPPLPRYRAERARQRLRAAEEGAAASALHVLRPRYLHLPGLWPLTQPLQLLALGLWAALRHVGGVRVVHGHRAYPMGVAAVLLGACLRRPAVVTLYGSDVLVDPGPGGPLLRFWIRLALRRAAQVVGVSRGLLERAAELGAPAARCAYVPSGVDLEHFRVRGRAEARRLVGVDAGRRLVLCTSHFVPVKGHAVLAEAFRILAARRADAALALTGDGPLRPRIEAAVREAGLEDRVRFLGNIGFEALPLWLAACDVVVLPSYSEGMPLSVLEAFACGRAVVGTRAGGTPELVADEGLGALVPPGDAAALAAALEEALDRPRDEARLRARAEEFGWPRVVERLLEAYDRAEAPAGAPLAGRT